MLKWVKRLLLLILLVVAVFVGLVLTSENSSLVSLSVFGILLPELSIGLWVCMALLAGAVIGLLISFFPLAFSRYTHSSKDKKIHQLQKELTALRVSGLKR